MKTLVYHRATKLTLAENWEEVTGKQFIALAGLLHSNLQDNDLLLDKALYILSGYSLLRFLLLPPYMRKLAQPHISWVFEAQHVTKQLLPWYRGLYGPDSDFDNMTMSEFHHSEFAFFKLVQENDKDALDELVGVLYRAPKKNYDLKKNIEADRREAFSYAATGYYKKQVKRWPLPVKQAVAIWYGSCRKLLAESYRAAFGAEKVEKDGNYYEGLFKMIRGLSGDKYGTFKQVEQMPLHNAFLEIVTALEEHEDLKRKYPTLYE